MTTPTRDEDLDTEHHIVIDILQELEGRKGMGISDLDEETQQEITDKFIEIVKEHLETAEREAFEAGSMIEHVSNDDNYMCPVVITRTYQTFEAMIRRALGMARAEKEVRRVEYTPRGYPINVVDMVNANYSADEIVKAIIGEGE